MKGRGFEEPFNQHSVSKTIINGQNMKLGLCSYTHNWDGNVQVQAKIGREQGRGIEG